jgi:hypothetical protein
MLGSRIQRLRESLGLNRRQAGLIAGVSGWTVRIAEMEPEQERKDGKAMRLRILAALEREIGNRGLTRP